MNARTLLLLVLFVVACVSERPEPAPAVVKVEAPTLHLGRVELPDAAYHRCLADAQAQREPAWVEAYTRHCDQFKPKPGPR